MATPTLHVVAGVNGAGKSTLTATEKFGDLPVVDPDATAREIAPDNPEGASLAAGRAVTTERKEHLEAGESFVTETTLSGRSALNLMEAAKESGFEVELHYVGVDSVAQSQDRVVERVEAGGHDVPEADQMRRFERSRENLNEAILIADRTVIYDNSDEANMLSEVAFLSKDDYKLANDAPDWAKDAASAAAELGVDRAAANNDTASAAAWCDRLEQATVAHGVDQSDIDKELGREKNQDDGHEL